jgi:hypothetical protein
MRHDGAGAGLDASTATLVARAVGGPRAHLAMHGAHGAFDALRRVSHSTVTVGGHCGRSIGGNGFARPAIVRVKLVNMGFKSAGATLAGHGTGAGNEIAKYAVNRARNSIAGPILERVGA